MPGSLSEADKQCERLDVITIMQVKIETHAVKHAARFDLQSRVLVKPSREQRSSQAKHVEFYPDLLRCNEKLSCFHRVLLCFTTNMSVDRVTSRTTPDRSGC